MNFLPSTFQTTDQQTIHSYQLLPAEGTPIKGIVQIIHGLSEHAQRYERFAITLTKQGYAVYTHDQRGHGQTAGSVEGQGFQDMGNFWDLALADIHQLNQLARANHPNVPVFLFGHSMGSLLGRRYVVNHGAELNGFIASGTAGDPGALGKIGLQVAKLVGTIYGKPTLSPFLKKLSFGEYNTSFKPARTDFDWLSRDPDEVDKYINDPYAGATVSVGLWIHLINGVNGINAAKTFQNTPKQLPILLMAGDRDPVGDMGKGVREVHERYQQAGIQDLTCSIYPEGRHELLNEINREEVMKEIIDWITARS